MIAAIWLTAFHLSFRSQLAKLGAQLALGSVGSDHLQRSHRTAQSEGGRKAKEVSCTFACVLLQGGRILFDCTGEYLIASQLLLLYSQERPTAEHTASFIVV